MSDFDAIVLGGGPTGEHCAARLADGGSKVAIVERELLGGECSYWACIPSKTLLRPGEALQASREAAVTGGAIDTAAAFAWRDFMVSSQWLQQATLAIRARVPLAVMDDVIQPFPSFSEVFLHALLELCARQPARV